MRVLSFICCFVGIMLTYTDTQASVNFIVNKSEITQTDSSNLEKPISETTCPTGYEKVGGICMDVNACETAFPLTSASNKVGSYVTKDCGTKGTRYCYTSCQTGWEKSGCECKAVDCSGFPFSESNGHHCNGIKSCKTGSNYKYQCTDCVDGYTLSSGSCVDKACSDHGTGYYSPVTDNCTSVKIGKTGDTYCYKCTKCKEGWTLNETNYKCDKNSCDYSTSRISNCIKYASITKTGSGLCYKCSTCADGYTLNTAGTACSSINCSTGYTTGMTNLSHCTNASTHVAGTSYCHKCNTCAAEYYVSSSKCAACEWDGHGLSSCPGTCNCSNKVCGILTKYKITSAKSGYYVKGSTCPECTWTSGYTLTSCPGNCNCSSNRIDSACSYKYKINSAKSGYYVKGSTCPACTWTSGYSLTNCPNNCNCSSNRVDSACSYKYKITSAQSGYYVSGNTCPENACTGYGLTACPANGNCSTCQKGPTTKYKLDSCKANYYVSGNSCVSCGWNGYTLTSCPSGCNCNSNACGGTTKYVITSAKSGYCVNGNTCPADCIWPAGYLRAGVSTCPSNCNCEWGECNGCKRLQVKSAKSGYYVKGTTCPECRWSTGYELESCPGNCNCSSDRADSVCSYKYKITSAKNGYYVSGNTCPENACTGYQATYTTQRYCEKSQVTTCQKGPNTLYNYTCKRCYHSEIKPEDGCSLPLKVFYDDADVEYAAALTPHLAISLKRETETPGEETYYSYSEAVDKCAAKTTGGKSWRLPTKTDLDTIKESYMDSLVNYQISAFTIRSYHKGIGDGNEDWTYAFNLFNKWTSSVDPARDNYRWVWSTSYDHTELKGGWTNINAGGGYFTRLSVQCVFDY